MKEGKEKKEESNDFWKKIGKFVKDKVNCCIE